MPTGKIMADGNVISNGCSIYTILLFTLPKLRTTSLQNCDNTSSATRLMYLKHARRDRINKIMRLKRFVTFDAIVVRKHFLLTRCLPSKFYMFCLEDHNRIFIILSMIKY